MGAKFVAKGFPVESQEGGCGSPVLTGVFECRPQKRGFDNRQQSLVQPCSRIPLRIGGQGGLGPFRNEMLQSIGNRRRGSGDSFNGMRRQKTGGQVIGPNGAQAGMHSGMLHGIAQFPNIARPMVRLQQIESLVGQSGWGGVV